jgi:predicted lipase
MITDMELLIAANNAYNVASTLVVDDVHVVLTEQDGITIVAFRGTQITDLADVIRDVSAWPMTSDEYPTMGSCHSGFLGGAISIFPDLKKLLEGKKFILVGHSLGGALAVATCGLCIISSLKPMQLTTFGAPSVGHEELKNLISPIPGNRWVDSNDPVPIISPYDQDRPKTSIGVPKFNPIDSHLIESGYLPDLITYYQTQLEGQEKGKQ